MSTILSLLSKYRTGNVNSPVLSRCNVPCNMIKVHGLYAARNDGNGLQVRLIEWVWQGKCKMKKRNWKRRVNLMRWQHKMHIFLNCFKNCFKMSCKQKHLSVRWKMNVNHYSEERLVTYHAAVSFSQRFLINGIYNMPVHLQQLYSKWGQKI